MDPTDYKAVEKEKFARSQENTMNPVRRRYFKRRYRIVDCKDEKEQEKEYASISLDFYQVLFPDEPRPEILTEDLMQKIMAASPTEELDKDCSKRAGRNTLQRRLDYLKLEQKIEYIADDEPLEKYENKLSVWEFDEEDLEKRYQHLLEEKKRVNNKEL